MNLKYLIELVGHPELDSKIVDADDFVEEGNFVVFFNTIHGSMIPKKEKVFSVPSRMVSTIESTSEEQ